MTKTLDPMAGRVVKRVRLLTKKEMAEEGWADDKPATAIEFEDGSIVYGARDEEGNGPGELFGVESDGVTFMLIGRET